ncbi:MAG: DNRLRE domain-containing protein [Ruminococcaceae bacterium]|nr:DNRLRE domain-containing protein [Oscillospiraceae bacterium]
MENLILDNICRMRQGMPLFTSGQHKNRYGIVSNEFDGSTIAYYHSCPIYTANNETVNMTFYQCGHVYKGTGSSCEMTVSNSIILKNQYGSCDIYIANKQKPQYTDAHGIYGENYDVVRTINGVLLKIHYNQEPCSIFLKADKCFTKIQKNNKCFAVMKDKSEPFVVVSCIGAADNAGNVIAPVILEHKEVSEGHEITFTSYSPYTKEILIEINLYEPKLFQDTTVESNDVDSNNMYGGTAFIGNTKAFGRQWLYLRPDLSKIHNYPGKKIEYVKLNIPRLNKGVDIAVFGIRERFCSRRSTWNNKVDSTHKLAECRVQGPYYSIDLTDILVDKRTGMLKKSNGLLLKALGDSGFAAISTADSYCMPQILEIKYIN